MHVRRHKHRHFPVLNVVKINADGSVDSAAVRLCDDEPRSRYAQAGDADKAEENGAVNVVLAILDSCRTCPAVR